MIELDQMASQFRASVKERPVFAPPRVERILLITDLPRDEGRGLLEQIRRFLRVLEARALIEWSVRGQPELGGVRDMLAIVEAQKPDLIVTYRHLFEEEKDLPHSLGTYADMLTQATTTPVLLLPNPSSPRFEAATANTDRVMVVTDHIVGDDRLINWGLRIVETKGTLILSHVEDDATFNRYMDVISKIPGIDTELARNKIDARLLKEAREYLESAKEGVDKHQGGVDVEILVRRGHTVRDYEALVASREVDVLVLNTHDEDQVAMAGMAYSLAIELIDKPLLLL